MHVCKLVINETDYLCICYITVHTQVAVRTVVMYILHCMFVFEYMCVPMYQGISTEVHYDRPVCWGGSGGSKEPPFLTERSTIFNDNLQKILLQTSNFHFKAKFGEKIGRENGLLLNPIH